ncbi:MAG: hypothetical protein DYG93_11945 [Leptolyngbya sp. PLA2]|nr:hypothetical protein [Leptolyngbya sp. PL-A2]MCZ7632496.1 hypothetical protein [Phycisphaerales bacterium]MDL1905048.1 hypothetical protein [Synechococcales cyanobacterium CNB]GIK19948.1 MAG: hypothetical protein BroJett004_21120 [Planctomycetota bacterium]
MPHFSTPSSPLDDQLRVLPIIVGGLIAGLITFAVIVLMVAPGGPLTNTPAPAAPSINTPLLVAVAGLMFVGVVGFIAVGASARARARSAWQERADDEQGAHAVGAVLLNTTIVRAALVEGPGLFGCVSTLITGHLAGLAAAAVSVVFLVSLVPVRSRSRALLEHATAGAPSL